MRASSVEHDHVLLDQFAQRGTGRDLRRLAGGGESGEDPASQLERGRGHGAQLRGEPARCPCSSADTAAR